MSLLSKLFPRRDARPLEPQAAYAKWAETYPPFAHNALMRVEQSETEAVLSSIRASRALDVGTGTGRYLDVLANANVAHRVGLDLSAAMIARARPSGATLLQGDALHLPFAAASFDLVLSSLMVGDVSNLSSWAREMSRVLSPGGALVYSDFHPSWTDNGWRRTFVANDGRTRSVRYHPHTLDDHRDALRDGSLRIVSRREPAIDGSPVCLVLHARKEPA